WPHRPPTTIACGNGSWLSPGRPGGIFPQRRLSDRSQCTPDADFLLATGFVAGFALACGALSQPPFGAATLTASSGCGSALKVWIASLAAASDCGSSRLATSSRLVAASAPPWAAARVNHL